MQNKLKTCLLVLITSLWIGLSVYGVKRLLDYSSEAGVNGVIPIEWPSQSKIERQKNVPILIMFVHPKCPCTRASLAELKKILAVSKSNLIVTVVFSKAAFSATDWEKDFLWESVKHIEEIQTYVDLENHEAKMFGINTSGQTVLYDENGHLIFHGGITASRGHEGDNLGQITIINYLKNGSLNCTTTKAYGCLIYANSLESSTCCQIEEKESKNE